ncbi:MAG: DinB family protein [Pseudomonadota bacterium]
MKAHFQMFAAYNAWANARLYGAAGALSRTELDADLGAFFRSILGTLNHIMVADLIWLARLRAQRQPLFELDHVLHSDFAELSAARKVLDDDVIRVVDEAPAAVDDAIAYTRAGREERQGRAQALAHLFNHQTHHRGQVHAMLTRLGHAAPSLDLLYYQRATSQ